MKLHLKKIQPTEPDVTNSVKTLTFEDLGEFLFNILEINPEDRLGLYFTTGRYNTREVQFKPEFDVAPYQTLTDPKYFKDHKINVSRVLKNVTRITFKNVPMSVPDEEIIHLSKTYGTPIDNTVHREMVRLQNPVRRTVTGSTRYVDVILNSRTSFRNVY